MAPDGHGYLKQASHPRLESVAATPHGTHRARRSRSTSFAISTGPRWIATSRRDRVFRSALPPLLAPWRLPSTFGKQKPRKIGHWAGQGWWPGLGWSEPVHRAEV